MTIDSVTERNPPSGFLSVATFAEYFQKTADWLRLGGEIPLFDPVTPNGDAVVDGDGNWRSEEFRQILEVRDPEGVAPSESAAVVAARLDHPSSVCAWFLARATSRPIRSIDDMSRMRAGGYPGSVIYVLPYSEGSDEFLLGQLSDFAIDLQRERPLWRIPGSTLVTARNLPALSAMVAKMIAAHRRSQSRSLHLRHYAPGDKGGLMTDVRLDGAAIAIERSALDGAGLLRSYANQVDVVAFRTHGSEACAKGGDGTVLCGLNSAVGKQAGPGAGILACGHGLKCPRGPNPVPLSAFRASVMLLGSCNGLRLSGSLTQPDFNFALSFADGPGVAFVSTLFSGMGGDIAASAFMAAVASGYSIGAATALVNALLVCGRIEHSSFVAIADYDYRPSFRNPIESKTFENLPQSIDARGTHCVEFHLTDPALVEKARRGCFALRLSRPDRPDTVFGFHRVESRHDGTETLAMRLFSFPEEIGVLALEAVDLAALQDEARRKLETLQYWFDLWQMTGLGSELPDAFAELRQSLEEARSHVGRDIATSSLDGCFVDRLERGVAMLSELNDVASMQIIEHLTPQLQGAFWLSNLYRLDHYSGSTPSRCPCCDGVALRRILKSSISGDERIVTICPHCGIASDIPRCSQIAAIEISLAEVVVAGETLTVEIRVRLDRLDIVKIFPRLSTHGEDAPLPAPASAGDACGGSGAGRFVFEFPIPLKLSPHRHYIKLLAMTQGGLAFASRPFFVRPPA